MGRGQRRPLRASHSGQGGSIPLRSTSVRRYSKAASNLQSITRLRGAIVDVNTDLRAQLEKARLLRHSIETERDARKRAIEDEYAAKVRGLEKVIAGYLETLGEGQPPLIPEAEEDSSVSMALARAVLQREPGISTIAESILYDLKAVPGRGITMEELTANGLRRGFMGEAKKPKDSVRSILYALADKGLVERIAPKTWALKAQEPVPTPFPPPPPPKAVTPFSALPSVAQFRNA